MSNMQLSAIDSYNATYKFFSVTAIDSSATNMIDLSYSNSGTIYIAHNNFDNIYNVTTDGSSLIRWFNTAISIDSNALTPAGVSATTSGTLFYQDNTSDIVYNITIANTVTEVCSIIGSFNFNTQIDSSSTLINGISWSNSNTLWSIDAVNARIYNYTTAGSLINFFLATDIDSSATEPRGVTWSNSNNLWFVDNTTNKAYNITTDGGSLISVFNTTDSDSSATTPRGISWTNSGLWLGDINTDKVYNLTNSGTAIVRSYSLISVDLNPTYDYEFVFAMTNRQDIRTKAGNLYTYIEPGRFRKFSLPLTWINSSDVSQISSWWENGQDLQFVENSDFPNSYFDVRIIGEENPFNSYVRPYFQQYYAGELIIETI